MFDPYRRNRETGSFIMVDRISHETVAAGMFLDVDADLAGKDYWDETPISARLERAVSHISQAERVARYGQQPFTILISGLSGSGKTTVALDLEKHLFEAGKKCVVLDGQNMRYGISSDLGFSAEERSENLRRAAEFAKTLNEAGLICIAAFVAPHDEVRKKAKHLIGEDRFLHIHLATPLEECRKRDKSGRYDAAERGEISDFPSITSEYQEPHDPDLSIRTDSLPREEIIEKIYAFVGEKLG